MKPVKGYNWVKLHAAMLEDWRIGQLSDRQFRRYVELMLIAGKSDAGGLLAPQGEPITVEGLAYMLRCDPGALTEDIGALSRAGLVTTNGGFSLTDWENWQGPSAEDKRDYWRKAQAKHRAKALQEPGAESEPDQETDTDQEQEAEPEGEGEIEKRREDVKLTDVDRTLTPQPVNKNGSLAGASASPADPHQLYRQQAIRAAKLLLQDQHGEGYKPRQEWLESAADECYAWASTDGRGYGENGKGYNPYNHKKIAEFYELHAQAAMRKENYQPAYVLEVTH